MKRTNLIIATIIVFGIGLFFVPNRTVQANSIEIEFGNACKNVKFTYKNGTNKYTQITKVKYYNQDETRWQTETIPFNYCPPNDANCGMPTQDLQNSEGDNITKIIFEFKTSNSYNGPWDNSSESQEFHPSSPKCNANRSYGNGTSWVVTASNSSSNNSDDSGSCKNVSIKVTNGRSEKIRFREVTFFNKSSGNWKDDNLVKTECLSGQTCTIAQEENALARNLLSLADANGDDVTKMKIGYEYLPNTRGAKWSSKIESKVFEPSDPTCREGKVFGNGQKWTIGVENSSNNSTNTNSGSTTSNTTESTDSSNSGTPSSGSSSPPKAGPKPPGTNQTMQQSETTTIKTPNKTKVATPAPKPVVRGQPHKKKP